MAWRGHCSRRSIHWIQVLGFLVSLKQFVQSCRGQAVFLCRCCQCQAFVEGLPEFAARAAESNWGEAKEGIAEFPAAFPGCDCKIDVCAVYIAFYKR